MKTTIKEKPWSKLNKVEKRKKLAQDVIYNIKAKKIIAYSGDYGNIINVHPAFIKNDDTKKILEKHQCEVCAIGALMASDILNRNSFKGLWNDADIIKRIAPIFSEYQLKLMEVAFEEQVIFNFEGSRDAEGYRTHEVQRAIEFGNKYVTDRNRLIAIMNSIIKHPEGLFVP